MNDYRVKGDATVQVEWSTGESFKNGEKLVDQPILMISSPNMQTCVRTELTQAMFSKNRPDVSHIHETAPSIKRLRSRGLNFFSRRCNGSTGQATDRVDLPIVPGYIRLEKKRAARRKSLRL